MKIDIFRGTLQFERGSIWPTLNMAEFLETPIGRTAKKGLVNDSWTHYDFDPEEGVLGTVLFDGHVIDRIFLVMRLNGDSPDTWSVERELERKVMHERWLQRELGKPPYSYAWGRVVSEFDPKGLASEIIVVYER
jgi:hypothetical protein